MVDALAVLHNMCAFGVSSSVLTEEIAKHPVFAALAFYGGYRLICKLCEGKNVGERLASAGGAAAMLRPMLPARVVIYASLFVLAIGLAPATASPFIYFAF